MLLFGWIAFALISSAGASPDPLQPAAQGMVQCYLPDDLQKTCQSIASYRLIEGANYSNTAVVALSRDHPVTLETTAPVIVKNGAVCGFIRADDIIAGKLRVDGRLLVGDEAESALASAAQSMAPMFEKEICTTYDSSPTGLIARISIDGSPQPGGDLPVKWVSPDAGYVVSP